MNDTDVIQARFSDDYSYIIDSDDNRVEFNDPRVTHVWAVDTSLYTSRLIASMYGTVGTAREKCISSTPKSLDSLLKKIFLPRTIIT